MKKIMFLLCLTPFLSFGLASETETDAAVTLTGEYVWVRRDGNQPGEIKAVFTPVKDGEWTVAFYFDFREKAHIYEGTAKGSLDNGELVGSVKNDEKNRTFHFKGTTANGTFTGTHLEERSRGDSDTGTITLSPAK